MQSSRSSGRAKLRLIIIVSVLILRATPMIASVDADDDGYVAGVDCNDSNNQVWALPGEASNLRFTNKVTFIWDTAADLGGTSSSVLFDSVRSNSASDFSGAASCLDPSGLTASSTDTAIPPPGTMYYYVVRVKNACGDGTCGARSGGVLRVVRSCDCSQICDDGLSCTRDYCSNGACVHDALAPTVQQPPDSVATCPGGDARFSIRATGQGALHYQWKKNGLVVGSDAPALTLNGVAVGDNGAQVTCVVTDGCTSTSSSAAVLTVFPSVASCGGGGNGLEAPNGAGEGGDVGSGRFYKLQLEADTDGDGQYEVLRTAGSNAGSVYVFSGEYYLEDIDLVIEGRGFDFVWGRKYRSREGRLTAMGQRWDFSYNRSVSLDPLGNLVVADGNSRRDTYSPGPTGCYTAVGFFRELCPQSDGTYVLTFPNKTTWKFAALDGSAAQGRIVEVRDSNANTMTFAYGPSGQLTTIADTLGRTITVAYNSDGFISAVTDFAGRQVSYSYYTVLDADGSPGDLKSVTSPAVTGTPNGNDYPAGKTTLYTYTKGTGQPALDHNLLTITDPTGAVFLRNTYTAPTSPADPRFDRIDRQTLPNGTIDYVYIAQTPSPGSDAVTKTIVNDRVGNVREVFFNVANQLVKLDEYTGRAPNPVLPTDDTLNRPTGQLRQNDRVVYEIQETRSPDSLLTSATFPEGNSVVYMYDSANPDVRLRANLLQTVALPGPRGGDQTSITESWTYGTSFGTEPCASLGGCGEGGDPAGRSVKAIKFEHLGLADAGDGSGGGDGGGATAGRASSWPINRARMDPYKNFRGRTSNHETDKQSEDNATWFFDGSRRSRLCDDDSWDEASVGIELPKGNNDAGVLESRWTSHTDGLGHTYTRDIDPATGNVLQVTAPAVTTGTLSRSPQTISGSCTYNAFGQVLSHTNPTERLDLFTYYTSGSQTGYLKDVTVDAPSPLPGAHAALLTVTVRDAFGNATAITDARGNTESRVFNQLDEIVRHVSKPPFIYPTDYRYDANDRLIQIDQKNLDETGAPAARHDPYKNFKYDSLGHLVSANLDGTGALDPIGGLNITTKYEYDANDHVTLVKLPESLNGHQPHNVVRTLFDERDLLFRLIDAEGDPAASTTQWDYDGNGNVVAKREGLESAPRVTTYQHDGYDRRVSVTDAMGNVTTSHYDANGNMASTRTDGELIDGESGSNVRLSEETLTYDEVNRPVQQDVAFFDPQTGAPIGAGIATTKTFYDEASQVVRIENANGHVTDMSYDNANRRASTHDAKGNTRVYGYDANGNVLTVTETEVSDLPTPPEVFVTTNTFDSLDRKTLATSPGGISHTFSWDSRSNQTVHVDPRGNVTRSVYDAISRLTATQMAMTSTGDGGGTVSYVLDRTRSYDADSRLVQQADHNGNATIYQYDPLGRTIATIYADGTSETTVYDVHGNPVSTVDANGTVTTTTFDLLNRITVKSVARAAGVLGTTSETWKYDGLSRTVYAQNNASLVTQAYDSLSDVTQETLKVGSGPVRPIGATFDPLENRTSVTYPSGLTVATTYDELERMKTVTASGPGVCSGGATPGAFCTSNADCLPGGTCTPLAPRTTTYDYAGPERVIRLTNPNGTQTAYAYDSARRVAQTTHAKVVPYTPIDDRTYAWDPMDNKISRTKLGPPGTGSAHSYNYDSAARMIHSVETPPSGASVPIDYSLDGVSNRTAVTGGPESGSYLMSSVLPEPADHQVNQYTSTPFDGLHTYDRNGNLTQKPGTGETMSYDYRDQMVQSTGPLGTVTYAYDALGRRIGASTKQYVNDGEQEIEARSPSGALTTATVYGNGQDELLHVVALDFTGDGIPDVAVMHTDDLGNVVASTNLSGSLLESYEYGDFGKPRFFNAAGSSIAQSAIGNPFLFNGRRYDATTGLYYYRTRYLDPAAGRFSTRDSIGMWGDEGNLGNGSAYVGTNPWSRTDPTGEARDLTRFILPIKVSLILPTGSSVAGRYYGQTSNQIPFTLNRATGGLSGTPPGGSLGSATLKSTPPVRFSGSGLPSWLSKISGSVHLKSTAGDIVMSNALSRATGGPIVVPGGGGGSGIIIKIVYVKAGNDYFECHIYTKTPPPDPDPNVFCSCITCNVN